MEAMHAVRWVSGAVVLLGLCACSGEDVGSEGAAGTGGAAGEGQVLASQNSAVSDCGGFEAGNRGPVGYCDAEKLRWFHDGETGTLALMDARVMLNCCGEHSFDVYYDASRNVYEAWEIDAPENIGGSTARCNCACVFDFKTEVADVAATSIDVVLIRHVTDQGTAQQIWSGTLDLAAGSGEVVLDDQPMDYGCGEY